MEKSNVSTPTTSSQPTHQPGLAGPKGSTSAAYETAHENQVEDMGIVPRSARGPHDAPEVDPAASPDTQGEQRAQDNTQNNGQSDLVKDALQLIDQMRRGEHHAVRERFTDLLVKETEQKVGDSSEGWEQLVQRVGDLQEVGEARERPAGDGLRKVEVQTRFERGLLITTIIFDAQKRVAGLWFRDPQVPAQTN